MYLSQIKKMSMVDIRYQFILKYKDHKESTPWKTTWLYFFQNNKIKQHIALIFFSLKIIWQNPTNFVGKITVINFCFETCSHYNFSNMG